MQISDKQLTKFQRLYKSRFGIELSKKEAAEEASTLLNLMKIVHQPITQEDLEMLQKRNY